MINETQHWEEQSNRFRDSLRRAGVTATHQRLEVFREVAGSRDHPDAETIFRAVRKRIPAISLDTVYRTLWLLLDLGLLNTLGPPRARVRFDANLEPHHHFICIRCGEARDFHWAGYDHLEVPAAVTAFGGVEKTHVEVRGVCLDCMKGTKSNQRAKRKKEHA